jgi:hypothetical protein
MGKQDIYRTPKYFIAVFGEKYADKDPVDGGHYPLGRLSNKYSYIVKGDVMLLYCTGSYLGHDMEAPAIAIVVDTQTSEEGYTLQYRYLPLDQPVPRYSINESLEEEEKNYFVNPGANFIFEVANTSFRKLLKDRYINWP